MFSQKSQTPEQIAARKEKRRRFWRKTLRRALWSFAILFVLHLSLNIYASIQLNRELAAVRSKGQPLRFSELAPAQVPDAENAAWFYLNAAKVLKYAPGEKAAARGPRDEASIQLAESAVARNQLAIKWARHAGTMPSCRFPINWNSEDPSKVNLTYYGDLRELVNLMAAEAELKARRGDKSAALSDVLSIYGAAKHLSKDPALIGFMVAQALNGKADLTLAEVLRQIDLTPREAQAFEASIPKVDWIVAYRTALLSERAWEMSAFEAVRPSNPGLLGAFTQTTTTPSWLLAPLVVVGGPAFKLDQATTLKLWRIQLDNPDFDTVPQTARYLDDVSSGLDHIPRYAILTHILYPAFTRTMENRDGLYVRQDQRQIALALACYRTTRGHYPSNLNQLASFWGRPMPLDLYSKKPFVYRPDGKSFLLYSVGPNRVDDQGRGWRGLRTTGQNDDDITWSRRL